MSHPWTIPMCCVWNLKRKCASYFRSLSHGTLLQYKNLYMLWRTPFVIANVFSTLRNFPLAIYIVVSYKCSSSLCVKSGWWLHQLHAACVCVAHANTALTNWTQESHKRIDCFTRKIYPLSWTLFGGVCSRFTQCGQGEGLHRAAEINLEVGTYRFP